MAAHKYDDSDDSTATESAREKLSADAGQLVLCEDARELTTAVSLSQAFMSALCTLLVLVADIPTELVTNLQLEKEVAQRTGSKLIVLLQLVNGGIVSRTLTVGSCRLEATAELLLGRTLETTLVAESTTDRSSPSVLRSGAGDRLAT